MCSGVGVGPGGSPQTLFFSFTTRVFGSQNLTTVKLKGVGESFKKYPDYESKGIKAHFNLDESGVLSLHRVREGGTFNLGKGGPLVPPASRSVDSTG